MIEVHSVFGVSDKQRGSRFLIDIMMYLAPNSRW